MRIFDRLFGKKKKTGEATPVYAFDMIAEDPRYSVMGGADREADVAAPTQIWEGIAKIFYELSQAASQRKDKFDVIATIAVASFIIDHVPEKSPPEKVIAIRLPCCVCKYIGDQLVSLAKKQKSQTEDEEMARSLAENFWEAAKP